VRAIGGALATDPKPIYRKLGRILRTLRERLSSVGIDRLPSELTA
jgi:hypothetical protein